MDPAPTATSTSTSTSAPQPTLHTDTSEAQRQAAEAAVSTLIKTFVDRTVFIHISDGRAFRGRFLCVDNAMNVILADADELRLIEAPHRAPAAAAVAGEASAGAGTSSHTSRWVGMVMIPGEHVRGVEIRQAEISMDTEPTRTNPRML